jgi:hypothetical protein
LRVGTAEAKRNAGRRFWRWYTHPEKALRDEVVGAAEGPEAAVERALLDPTARFGRR